MKFETKTIHAGQSPDKEYGAVMPPIYLSTTFAQKEPGVPIGNFDYTRAGNPSRDALEKSLAALENGTMALAFSSGLSAIDAVLKLLKPGDEVISVNDLYGGSYRIFTKTYEPYGLIFKFVDLTDASTISSYINEKTKLVWLETPTNPLLQIVDIEKISQKLKEKNIWLAVDNTFASPALQNPLEMGADIVMHSATKYLGGHSDVLAGAIVVKDRELGERIRFQQFATGAVLSPQDSYMLLRGIKTLALRMERHSKNAKEVAKFLTTHPEINKVFYPGLETHPNHEIAKKQMKDYGGMLSFNLKTGKAEDAIRILQKLHIFTLAESLGGVESLASLPSRMTHASIPLEKRKEIGITEDLIRLSVGIEHIDDLIGDIENAMEA